MQNGSTQKLDGGKEWEWGWCRSFTNKNSLGSVKSLLWKKAWQYIVCMLSTRMHPVHTHIPLYIYARATSSRRDSLLPRLQWSPPVKTSGRWSMRESVVWLWCCQTWWRVERLGWTELYTGCWYCMLFSLEATFLSQEVCYQYWPADDTKGAQKYGEFTVSVLRTTKQNGFIQCEISIKNPKVMGWVSKIGFVAYTYSQDQCASIMAALYKNHGLSKTDHFYYSTIFNFCWVRILCYWSLWRPMVISC